MAEGYISLGTSGAMEGRIYYYSSSNGSAANTSNVYADVQVRRTDSYTTTGTWTGSLNIGGENRSFSHHEGVSSWISLFNFTKTVPHNNDGTGSCYIAATINGPSGTSLAGKTVSGNQTVTLDTIPRYTTITGFLVGRVDETRLNFHFSTSDIVDYAWYSINNGSSWTGVDITDGTAASFYVTNLSPNTTYNCKVKVRRKDSQLVTESGTKSQTTFATPTQTFQSKTETSITMKWSMDENSDHLWYSINNGSSWVDLGSVNASSGTYTISGLNPNTTYNIKTRLRRGRINQTTDTTAMSQTTYAYPYCTEAPNFTIGNNVTIKLYNPLNRTVELQMYSRTSSSFVSNRVSASGTSYTGFSNIANNLYASIPNATTGVYNIDVHYGDNKAVKQGGTYSIRGTEKPTFSNFTFQDSNSVTSTVTGDDQVLVKGYSTLQTTISSANKMVAQNSATESKYIASCDNSQKTVNYSSSDLDIDLGVINNAGTKTINISAYDSRNLYTTVSKNIIVYDYSKPNINAAVERLNNYENQTTLATNGSINLLTIENTDKNTLNTLKYRYKEISNNMFDFIRNTKSSVAGLTCSVSNGILSCRGIPTATYQHITNNIDITSKLADGQTYTISQSIASDKLSIEVRMTKISDGTYAYCNCRDANSNTNSFTVDKSTYSKYEVYIITANDTTTLLDYSMSYWLEKGSSSAWSSFTDITYTLNNNAFYGDNVILSLDNAKEFEFEILAEDNITSNIIRRTVNKGKASFFIKTAGGFESNGDSEINGITTLGDTLKLSENGFEDYHAAGYIHDKYGNFIHKSNTSTDNWHIDNYSGEAKFRVYPETGEIKAFNQVGITKDTGDTYFKATRSDTNVVVNFGVGAGGTNHGIYSEKLGKWMVYADASDAYLNGTSTNTNYIKGFEGERTGQTWGNQTGTFVAGMYATNGSEIAFRRDNPSNGQLSIILDGTVYVNEGKNRVYGMTNLYNNSSGNNGTVTLSETSANFTYLDIYYKDNDGYQTMSRVYSPNGKTAILMSVQPSYSGSAYLKQKSVAISGTSITNNNYSEAQIGSGSSFNTNNRILIVRVDGWR